MDKLNDSSATNNLAGVTVRVTVFIETVSFPLRWYQQSPSEKYVFTPELLLQMMNEIITALFNALPIAVIEHLDDCSFRMIGTIPDWFKQFYSDAAQEQVLIPKQNFSFLENFLVDAKSFWLRNSAGILKSGIWSELDISGKE